MKWVLCCKIKYQMQVKRFICMNHTFKLKNNMARFWKHKGVLYIQKTIKLTLDIFKRASIKNHRTIYLKMTFLTSSWPLLHFLFVLSLSPHLRIVHSYGYVTIAGIGMQNLTYALHSWLLRWKGSLTCHTY